MRVEVADVLFSIFDVLEDVLDEAEVLELTALVVVVGDVVVVLDVVVAGVKIVLRQETILNGCLVEEVVGLMCRNRRTPGSATKSK